MLRLARSLVVVAIVLVSACGGKQSTTSTAPPPASVSVAFEPITVPPFTERTQCVTRRLPNDGQIRVGQIHNVLGPASHHMIVYRVNDTEEQLQPTDCFPFRDTLDPSKGSPLMVTQKHDDLLTLPEGVAFTLAPHQMVRIELHYINPTGSPVQLQATSTFVPISEASYHDEADFLFIGDIDVKIAPHATSTLGPVFYSLPRDYAGVKFFAITGHEHAFGTGVDVEVAPDKASPGTPVYSVPNWSWSEPATVQLSPPVSVDDGGGFRFTCRWNNTSDRTVRFGESAEDEMCFFWAYYYPSQGARVCIHTDQRPGGVDMCCPGGALCSLLQQQLP